MSVLIVISRHVPITASRTANTRADQNPSKWNHGTIFATKSTIKTFIIRLISPNERMFNGKVTIFNRSPMVLLTTARTTATTSAVMYPSTWAPGVKYEAMSTAKPDIKKFKSKIIQRKFTK